MSGTKVAKQRAEPYRNIALRFHFCPFTIKKSSTLTPACGPQATQRPSTFTHPLTLLPLSLPHRSFSRSVSTPSPPARTRSLSCEEHCDCDDSSPPTLQSLSPPPHVGATTSPFPPVHTFYLHAHLIPPRTPPPQTSFPPLAIPPSPLEAVICCRARMFVCSSFTA